jgi:hypothetical protein
MLALGVVVRGVDARAGTVEAVQTDIEPSWVILLGVNVYGPPAIGGELPAAHDAVKALRAIFTVHCSDRARRREISRCNMLAGHDVCVICWIAWLVACA